MAFRSEAGTIGGATTTLVEVPGPSPVQANTWTHLAVTYDGNDTTLRLYVNGAMVASQVTTGSIRISTTPLQIGGDSIYGQFFAGLIDDVRVYNIPLSAAEIQADMATAVGAPTPPTNLAANAVSTTQVNLSWTASTDNVGVTNYLLERCTGASCTNFAQVATPPGTTYNDTGLTANTTYRYRVRATDAAGNLSGYSNIATATTQSGGGGTPGLVAAYAFDEGSGTTVSDASGNGNNGTVSGTSWTTSGKNGGALSFNGTTSRVTVPDSASLHLTTAMTLEAWVNPTTVTKAWRDVIYKGNDNYYLEATSSTGSIPAAVPDGGGIIGGVGKDAFGTTAITASTWTHLAATYDGTTVRLFVNGTQVATKAAAGSITTSTNPLQIGGDSIYGQFFSGLIDDVRVYSTALTAAQIATDMATGVSAPTAPANLTATAVSTTQINLSWSASTNASGYLLERCQGAGCANFVQIATPPGTTFNDTGLAATTSYSYRVRATNGSGQTSPYSNVATAFTGVAVSPAAADLTFTQTQQYTAVGSRKWQCDLVDRRRRRRQRDGGDHHGRRAVHAALNGWNAHRHRNGPVGVG